MNMIAGFLRAHLLAVAALALSAEFAAADDPPAANKLPSETEKSAAKLYADNCVTCHQANGQGVAVAMGTIRGNFGRASTSIGERCRHVVPCVRSHRGGTGADQEKDEHEACSRG
jgi:Cytochrome c